MKKIILALLALTSGVAGAATLASVNNAQFALNQASPEAMRTYQLGTAIQKNREHTQKCVYDFSKQGGAIGAINLLDQDGKNCTLPNKSIIRDVLIDVVTTPTSGGSATIAIGSGAATNDFKAATAVASYTGLVAGVPVGTAATAIKLAADQKPTITVATAALTAGKLNVQIRFQMSE